MKILLIHAKINYDNMEPLGLLSLATTLKEHGHTVKVLDIFPEKNSYWMNIVKMFSADLIGYGFETPSYERIKEIHGILTRMLPNAIYCAGGIHPSVLPEETLRELNLHFVVYGEAETSFPILVNSLERSKDLCESPGIVLIKDGQCIKTKPSVFIEDLDSIPFADRSLLVDNEFYFYPPGNIRGLVNNRCATIITSRGCPFNCIFCESKILMGKKYRQRSPQHVVNEIEYLRNTYGIQAIYFADDIFTYNAKWITTFCDLALRLPFRFLWGCQSRADTLTENMLVKMRTAGCCQIDIGIESGDPDVLKNIKKNETVEQYIKSADLIHRTGIRLLLSFIVGSPGETWESIKKTKALIHRMKPSICQYFTLVPYPGSELYKIASENRWLGKVTFDQQGSQKQCDRAFLSCGLSPDDQVKARKILHRNTFVRDHFNLIVGWFYQPKWLLLWFWILLKNLFFLGTAVKSMRDGNPLLVMFKAYETFNLHILSFVRKKGKV